MNPGNSKIVNILPPTTAIVAGGTVSGYVDTIGFDYLQINIAEISASAATACTALRCREDDTVPTAFTDMTAIVALNGGAAVSATAGFVLPFPRSAGASGNTYRFNIDLNGRKRYIGLEYTPGVSNQISATALLLRCENGPAQATSTNKTATTDAHSCRVNVYA